MPSGGLTDNASKDVVRRRKSHVQRVSHKNYIKILVITNILKLVGSVDDTSEILSCKDKTCVPLLTLGTD